MKGVTNRRLTIVVIGLILLAVVVLFYPDSPTGMIVFENTQQKTNQSPQINDNDIQPDILSLEVFNETNTTNETLPDDPDQEPETTPSGGGSSGGGGGPAPVCTPNWENGCSSWSACTPEDIQTRICTDINNCGINEGRPTETQSCNYVEPIINDSCDGLCIFPKLKEFNSSIDNNFNSYVYMSTNKGIYGIGFTLLYNPNIINLENIEIGNFLTSDGSNIYTDLTIDNINGLSSYAITRMGHVGNISGEGIVANLNFSIVGNGTTQIDLTEIMIPSHYIDEFGFESIGKIMVNHSNATITITE